MKCYLSFGEEMDGVDCVFPQLGLYEEYESYGVYTSPSMEETVELTGEIYIAGGVGDTLYVLFDEYGVTGYAPQEWFWEGNG